MDVEPYGVVTAVCRVCGSAVPAAAFCDGCGADLGAPESYWRDLLRPKAFASAPGEHVAVPMLTSSLFPHLARPSRNPFRVAIFILLAALAICSLLRWIGPLIAIAALGFPLLFVLYLWQTGVLSDMPGRVFVALVVGAGLGVGWTLLTGNLFARSHGVPFATGLVLQSVLSSGLVASLAGAVLMVVPAIVVRMLQPPNREALDGFVVGALGAMSFTGAGALAWFGPQFVSDLTDNVRTVRLVVNAALYGVAAPLTAGAAGGLIGIVLWFSPGRRADKRPWKVRGVLAFFTLLVAGMYTWIWVIEVARLQPLQQLGLHLFIAVLAVLVLRIGMQLALLHERPDPSTGQPILCIQCERVVPDASFCPACGVAARSASRRSRRRRREPAPVRRPASTAGQA